MKFKPRTYEHKWRSTLRAEQSLDVTNQILLLTSPSRVWICFLNKVAVNRWEWWIAYQQRRCS